MDPPNIRVLAVSENRAYSMTLPAGDYLASTAKKSDFETWPNPERLARLMDHATRVRIDWGERKNLSLTFGGDK